MGGKEEVKVDRYKVQMLTRENGWVAIGIFEDKETAKDYMKQLSENSPDTHTYRMGHESIVFDSVEEDSCSEKFKTKIEADWHMENKRIFEYGKLSIATTEVDDFLVVTQTAIRGAEALYCEQELSETQAKQMMNALRRWLDGKNRPRLKKLQEQLKSWADQQAEGTK